jgi:signal transduction histidine kinase
LFMATDRNNDPWITTSSGRAYRFSGGAWSDQTDALGKKPGIIGTMTDDAAGNVWFGFSNKVVEWDGSTYQRFAFPDGKRGVSENTMSVRGDHVWLGGAGGVQLFTRGQFYLMRWKDQVLPGRVSGLVETETGDLWVNGFSGITHVSAAELSRWLQDKNSAVSAEHLDELDGLPGLSGEALPEPSVVEGPDGRLWFATTKGIAWLDPAALEKSRNRVPPPVIISAVVAGGTTYAGSNALTLPARAENVEIDYTALSLAIPERVLFRYKLDGVDKDWQNAGTRRQAYYTQLRPGNYTFHVIASNNDGVWNEAGAAIGLKIQPVWFQTIWFFVACVTSAVLLASAFYRYRMGKVAATLKARFDERLAERTRIAQELHDTLLQGFLSASMQVHVAADDLPEDSEVKSSLTRALQVMGQVIDEGRNAVRGLRLADDGSTNLEQAFARLRQELDPELAKPEFHVFAEGEQRKLHPLLRDEIYRIGREALTNAFRHARASHINVEMKYGSKEFRLVVRDDGRGIDPEILHTGGEEHSGMSGMRERAERIGARFHVFSRAALGTEVELSVDGRVVFQDQGNRRSRWFRNDGGNRG